MDEEEPQVPDSPKPLSFTIDFSDGKAVDTERHKCLVEKYRKRHARGKSLSKLEEATVSPAAAAQKRRPLTGNLPRKSNYQSDGYYSSDEKGDSGRGTGALTLPLRGHNDVMAQSFPNPSLPSISSPEIELKDVSSPEFELVSPFSPGESLPLRSDENSVEHDRSDTVSDAGTYTLDADNYTEEQKARMSIDEEFKIEQLSSERKAEEYVRSITNDLARETPRVAKKLQNLNLKSSPPISPPRPELFFTNNNKTMVLSPIISPTQHFSSPQSAAAAAAAACFKDDIGSLNNSNHCEELDKTFMKIMFPRQQQQQQQQQQQSNAEPDLGTVISVTSSGAFRSKNDRERGGALQRLNLTKSEVHVVTYIDEKAGRNNERGAVVVGKPTTLSRAVQSVEIEPEYGGANKVVNLPPAVGGVSGKSVTKIPSPVHNSVSRPRSRSGLSNNVDLLSDSSLETESYLRPTQNYINSLQKRLSVESDPDSDSNYGNLTLNNGTRGFLKQKPTHVRHNSFDDRTAKPPNKLEHFAAKNLQHNIDQTFVANNAFLLNQYQTSTPTKTRTQPRNHQNSPNNPIRRSSSFSAKHQPQQHHLQKTTNELHRELNARNSPNLGRPDGATAAAIQRSASTTSIKANALLLQVRRTSDLFEQRRYKIDRNQFGDTEESSTDEEEFEKTAVAKKKDFSNITNTRYNRAFSLRRARLDVEQQPVQQLKCPNTPEMRRKFQPDHLRTERAISVDRKPAKSLEVQSRYLQNITRSKNVPSSKPETITKSANNKPASAKPQVFSRTDSGRFSTRSSSKPPVNASKNINKKDGGKKSNGRSNSSLSSREVEFQNWKRRKSYDPMKAAAEGKKKAEMAKRQNYSSAAPANQETNQNQDCDSSPSHSSSVHRSQSFHGTAALEKLISSEEDDPTFSADEGFSPPTPSPCELSPARATLRQAWRERLMH